MSPASEHRFLPEDWALWCWAAVLTLVAFLLAPKAGKGITAFILFCIFVLLVLPFRRLNWISNAPANVSGQLRFPLIVITSFVAVGAFGWYVWPDPITPENVESHLLTWLAGAYVRSVGRMDNTETSYFSLEITSGSGTIVGVKRRKDHGENLEVYSNLGISNEIRAKFNEIPAPQQELLSERINLDISHLGGAEYTNNWPYWIHFATVVPIKSDLTRHEFLQALTTIGRDIVATESSIDVHSRELGYPLGKPMQPASPFALPP